MSTKNTKKRSRIVLKSSNRSLLPSANLIGPADTAEQIQVTVRVRRGSSPGKFPSDADLGSSPFSSHLAAFEGRKQTR
jgi:hypothetical protein